jgi:cobalt-zinc-cadmium efflux system protein
MSRGPRLAATEPSGEGYGEGHSHGEGHRHGVSADANRFWLGAALALLLGFMAVEVVVGLLAGSLALLSDAAHMLTDAGAIALALVAIRLAARPARGGYTYGLKRAEILSAQANGITLLLLTVYFGYEGVRRLIDPPPVEGLAVLVTALVGIAVNLAAIRMIARANRSSLNVEGAFQHILTDLFAFIATAVAGLVMVLTGFTRADALAALVVAALMAKAGYGLVRESGRVFLEAAPRGIDPQRVETDICAVPGVTGVHELHVWEVTSGFPALSAHVLVGPTHDCHERRIAVEKSLADRYDIRHTTLQVDHRDEPDGRDVACAGPNGGCGDAAPQTATRASEGPDR